MVWLIAFANFFLLIAPLFAAESSSKDVDVTSLNEHVKKMDALLQEVQSHAQAQEQKYSAVLSSVLSQLTQTTEELNASRNVTEALQEELAELKESHNKTMEAFKELKQSSNKSLVEMVKKEVNSIQLNCSKSDLTEHGLLQLNSTETEVLVSLAEIFGQMNATGYIQLAGSKQPWIHKEIGFEAYLADTKHVLATRRVVFDRVPYNEGKGYNKSTGSFTAPVSGTYLLWVNIVYKTDLVKTTVFHIKTGNTVLAHAYGSSNERFGTASATTIFYLKKGERTWIVPSRDIDLQANTPSAGAVLIKHHLSI